MDEELKKLIEKQGTAFEAFKETNDKRLDALEKGEGTADFEQKLDNINKELDSIEDVKQSIEDVKKAIARPNGGAEQKGELSPEALEAKEIYKNWIKSGDKVSDAEITKLNNYAAKALSVGSESNGGVLVTPENAGIITTHIRETSPMRNICGVETISSDSMEFTIDNGVPTYEWVEETGSRSETDTPQLEKITIYARELAAKPKATQKLIDDASLDVESWLNNKIALELGRAENTAFVNGDGDGKPKGFLQYTKTADANSPTNDTIQYVDSGAAAAVTADGLIGLYYALKSEYSARGTWVMNRSTVSAIRKLKGSDNNYLWQPGLQGGKPDTLLGAPIVVAADMPNVGAGNYPIAFGDFRSYQIVDRTGIRLLRDPYSEKPFVQFYTTKRVGGGLINFEGIKLQKISA